MKHPVSVLFLLLFLPVAYGQSYRGWVLKADSLYQAGNYTASAEAYRKAFSLEKNNPTDLYNAACSAALAGDKKSAFDYLDLAFEKGYTNIRHLKSDKDLDILHADPQWKVLLERMQRKVDEIESNYDKALQRELLTILEDDQDVRIQWSETARELGDRHPKTDSLAKIVMYKDSINLDKVTRILEERGWVGKDLVGEVAGQAIFLVIQHADLKTQEKYLPLMRTAVEKKQAASTSLALLEDRIALRQGKKQLYGSQIYRNQETNAYYLAPLEDPDNVDQRRAVMGLGPVAAYVSRWGIVWDVEEYKKKLPEYEKLHRELLEQNKD